MGSDRAYDQKSSVKLQICIINVSIDFPLSATVEVAFVLYL